MVNDMANLNIRIDDAIKQEAFLAFEKMGVNPSDAVHAFLSYVANTGQMPIKEMLIKEMNESDDEQLVALIKKRMNEKEKIHETTLDELFS